MKRNLLLLALLFTMVAPLRAIFVAWELPTSTVDEDWWKPTLTGSGTSADPYVQTPKVSFNFVYSANALTATQVYDAAVAGTTTDSIVTSSNMNLKQHSLAQTNAKVDWQWENSSFVKNEDGTLTKPTGWFYVIVFNGTEVNQNYAVGGSQFTAWDGVENGGNSGVYLTQAGTDQAPIEYVTPGDFLWMSGTTWTAPTPEPTIFALLALGVAGVALRRKVR